MGRSKGNRPVTRPLRLALLAGAVALFAPAGAQAQQRVIAGPEPTTYLTTAVTLDRGEALRFFNADSTAPHDVASYGRTPDGSFLFKSDVVPAPSDVPVEGAERLRAGSYGFFCTIHPWMEGELTVRDAGGEGGAAPPEVEVRILDGRIRQVRRRAGLRTRVTVDQAARVRVTAAIGRGKRRRPIARGTRALKKEGSKRIVAKLTKAGKRALAGRDRARVTVKARAIDEDGNASKARARKVLR